MMNIDNLKNKQRHLPKALLFLSGLLALLIAAKVSAFVLNSNQIQEDIVRALNCPGRNEDNVKKFHSKYLEVTAALKKKNLFMSPAPPKKNPVTRVTAVLGNEARIADNWYEVGDKIGDAEITKISPNEVTVIWNDQESKLKPFDTVVFAAPPKQSSKDRNSRNDLSGMKDRKKPKPERIENNEPIRKPQFSEERNKKYMNRLTEEQRAKIRERMKSRASRGDGRNRGSRSGSSRPGGGSRYPDRRQR